MPLITTFRRKTTGGVLLLALVFFAIGYSGSLQKLGKLGTYLFHVYAEAELKKLEAAGYHNDKGEPEYVVSVNGQALGNGLGLLQQLDGITGIRGTLFDDWFVISVEAGNDAALNVIKRAAFVEFVLPNRGVWFCH